MYRDAHQPDSLNPDDVHVWQVDLKAEEGTIEALNQLLSQDERERADRFYFPEIRSRYIVARGVLRSLLGCYLDVRPQSVALVYNDFGKPSLDESVHRSDVHFNVSHSADLALFAFSRGRLIGIDIEAMREIVDADQIAAKQFDAVENASYQALPPEARREGFFVRWTLKEAYIKAHGRGLAIPLDSFTISSQPNEAGWHPISSGNPDDDRRWTAVRLPAPGGFMAALVVQGDGWELSCWRWAGSS